MPADDELPAPTVAALAPTFSPPPLEYFGAQAVVISTGSEGASIRYTTDGSDPTSTYGEEYTGLPINVGQTTIIKAVAYSPTLLPSVVSTGTYTIPGRVATPYVQPPAGTYPVAQTIAMSTATDGSEIYYTLDGSAPTASDGVPYVGPILIDKTTNVRAIAYKDGQTESNVMNVTFTIGVKVATPTFSIVGGTYAQSQAVAITTNTTGATIRYTTNGATPSQTYGTDYTGAITVSKTQTVKAIAYAAGKLDSNVATATYTIALDSNNAGDSTAAATDGTSIYIAYYSNAGDDLYFVRSTDGGASWDVPIAIDRIGLVGLHTSMFRKGSSLYVSYYDDTNDDLKVAISTNGGLSWSVYRADSGTAVGGNVGQYTGIYVDAANAIHVVYYDVTNTSLKYAKSTNSGNNWTTQTIENTADVGRHASIAGDSPGNLHVAYYDASASDLKYAKWDVGTGLWTVAAVDQTAGRDIGTHARIAVDGGGNVNVLYQDATAYDLKLARNVLGSWTVTTALSSDDVGSHIGFVVDSADHLNAVYYNDSQFRTEFVRSIDFGSTWSVPEPIDDSGVGQYASLAVSGITFWMSYYDAVNADLKAAKSTDDGVSWTIY